MIKHEAASDFEEVHAHLQRLLDAGHNQKTIGEASGVPHAAVHNLISRRRPITARTGRKILSVPIGPPWETPGVTLGSRSRIPGTGTVRRLRALTRMGFTIPMIAEGVGRNPVYLRVLINAEDPLVYVGTAERVAAFYRRALVVPPPEHPLSDRTQRWADGKGWVGPGLWDDIDNDGNPLDDGDLAVLVEYVAEHQGSTTRDLRDGMHRDLGTPTSVFQKLIKEALDSGEIVRLRTRRNVRNYTKDWKEDHEDRDRKGDEVRQAAVPHHDQRERRLVSAGRS